MFVSVQPNETLDPSKHILTDLDVTKKLRRDTKNSDVFSYWHALAHTWVLCLWINKAKGIFISLGLIHSLKSLSRNWYGLMVAKIKGTLDLGGLGDLARMTESNRQHHIQEQRDEADAKRDLMHRVFNTKPTGLRELVSMTGAY